MGPVKLIDNRIKDEVLRFPTVELIRRLFPGIRLGGRSVLRNPLRNDRHPSLSCFRDRSGFQRWKDHATGETGDNIDFYRKVYPELGYVEAVDRLSLLLLGKSAMQDFVPGESVPVYSQARRQRPVHVAVQEEAPVLQIVSDMPYGVGTTPAFLIDYTRERGISDEVAAGYFRYVVYENNNRKGLPVMDAGSGLPVVAKDGSIVREEARYEAVAMRNDIGGFSLRVPASECGPGFKGANMSFIATLLAGGLSFGPEVHYVGAGEGLVTGFGYNPQSKYLSVNQTQGFMGVEPWAAAPAVVFLDAWIGRFLEGRELRGAESVLRSLNGPVSAEVDVVEGMFDAVSVIEFEKMAGRGPRPVRDLVVLNSISNINWAVPFLAVHGRVRSLLDNDMSSSAGKKAYVVLKERVEEFSSRLRFMCEVRSDSGIFYPSKDINDYLKACKGFSKDAVSVPEKPRPRKERKCVTLPNDKSVKQIKP